MCCASHRERDRDRDGLLRRVQERAFAQAQAKAESIRAARERRFLEEVAEIFRKAPVYAEGELVSVG